MKKAVCIAVVAVGALALLTAQDLRITLREGERPTMAVPDFRGDAQAQPVMAAFNRTLWADLQDSGYFRLAPKTMYPKSNPQQPSDIRQPGGRAGSGSQDGGGLYLTDWSGPPVSATYLVFGYTAVQNGMLVLYGWMWDLTRGSQIVGNRYSASAVTEAGAQEVAHKFAADILAQFGGKSLFGTKVFFVSNRTGSKEIWAMDPDGGNQRQITKFGSISNYPAVSPDGSRIAFTSWVRGNPGIFVFSVDPVRDLRFYNQRASVNGTPSFTPDGKQILYSSSAPSQRPADCCRLFIANLDGGDFRAITSGVWIDTEPKVNPKTGSDLVFVSGRGGPQQIYRMNMDGSDLRRLTSGEGEASNPSWHPNGQIIAFAWTRGYAAGDWNVFTMDVANGKYTQLTHSQGKNENPSWAPDGVHLVFGSTRSGSSQIWTMLADGSQLRQLTTQGTNSNPVWGP